MPRRAIALLVVVGGLAGAASGWADRPLSDITCASGEQATYDRGAHRFSNKTIVLGCARLSGGQALQIDAGHYPGESTPTCLWLTSGPPRPDGIFACAHRLGPKPRVLLILRQRAPAPFLVLGVVPAGAERASVTYSSTKGSTERVRAQLLPVGDRLAERVGAGEPFGAFVAELGPGVDICEGIEPRAFGAAQSPSRGRPATPGKDALGRPDGWLAGFTRSYGIGYGPRDPNVCHQPPAPQPRDAESPAHALRGALDHMLGRLADLFGSVELK